MRGPLRKAALAFLLGSYVTAPVSPQTLRKEWNLHYRQGNSPTQQLDLYLPDTKGFPTVLFLHGGSLTEGDKSDEPYALIAERFAKQGIAFAAANYRLGPDNHWPAQAQDAAAAFAWLKRTIRARGGDPDRVHVFGHSSGALLAALLATDPKYLREQGFTPLDMAGVVAMGTLLNPSYDADGLSSEQVRAGFERDSYLKTLATLENYKDADPYRHLGSPLPPLLILIAEGERFQPPILEQAERFAQAAGDNPVQIVVLPGRRHMTALTKMAEPKDPTLKRIIDFVRNPGR